MKNLGVYPITLYPRLPVAHLVVEQGAGLRARPFHGQNTPSGKVKR